MEFRGGRGSRTNRGAGVLTAATYLVAWGLTGCGGHSGPGHPDAAASRFDARDTASETRDAETEALEPDAGCPGEDAGAKKAPGAACGCAADCASNFCVDGVCCGTACGEACKTCAAPGSVGTCTFLVAGAMPRAATACVAASASTCGLDGTCDGAGGCRRQVAGTICKAGQCDGAAVVGALACDGLGHCKAGPTTICAPYSCDPAHGACFEACAQSSQCATGQQCVNASCGEKMKGANCAKNADCASGFCADGVCCNVACGGGCVSCALTDRRGTCWPIDRGVADPRGQCVDQGAASCGATGTCDGFGGCEKYAPETICIAPSCTGTRRNTAGTCDGKGACRPQGVQNCSPFLCTDGACTQACVTDADCESGHACLNGQCGKKNLGQTCAGDGECVSGMCVEGVCCDGACAGGCRSCALASTMGRCTPLAAGAVDSKGVCADQGAATCATNGRCDGSGGCQSYQPGTVCAPESCSGNVYTPPSTCSATGQCAPPDSLPCAPYVCNGNSCFNACAIDGNCVTPNVCNGSSCGKKMRGASCSEANECQSAFCAQGVCCDTACAGACSSCALTGTLGTCTNVPTGAPDPSDLCADQGPASCGMNGKCQAGACQKYLQGTSCEGSTCPTITTTFTPGSTCDGQGACVTPAASSCFPFQCGVEVCKAACTTDLDCAAPAVCTNGSCGLKGFGKTCADGNECVSGSCAQGVCCDSACAGTCQSCVLSGSLGHCADIADGNSDPRGRCVDQGAASCGTDGSCDGKGACRVYAAGTACAAASCPTSASTLTQVRSCDGKGACKPATTQPCAPYLCNGISACKAACTVDADCLGPDICDPQTNLCGNKRRLGQTCGATSDCLTGNFCVDGVCCASSACGLCQTCATGACANVASGTPEPHAGCAATPPCGDTGNCNGAGACEQAGVGVACGAASCAGSTFMAVSHCTGTGSCSTPTSSSCSPYVCGANACKTVCATDADCVAPFTCQGSGATRSCALKANGLACGTGTQCISGNCVDGVCCGSASCPACQACNVSGTGACAPLAAGTAAPTSFCGDQGAATCGTNGKCNGAGGCQKYADGTACSGATCPAGAAALKLAGTCSSGACSVPTVSCAPYFCNGAAACQASCNLDGDCVGGNYCTFPGGTCAPMGVSGGACTAGNQCLTGHCVDGVCCGSVACGSCQACNVAGSAGTCAPLAAGAGDPKGVCADNLAASCGTNGKCDGAGGCQKYADGTACSMASCPAGATALTLAGTCTSGSCAAGTQSCNGFKCNGAAACQTTCNLDGDCAAADYCTAAGGSCVAKIAQGTACAADNQCGTNHCVDGVCCGSATCGSCQACNVGGSAGTCAPVGAGTTDPKHACVDNGAAACATNGKCDGAGGCQKYADGTTCAPASCLSSTLTNAGTCGGGTCGQTTQSCGAYTCHGTTACRATCAADGDCSPGNFCALLPVGACTATLDAGVACAAGTQCKSGNCVDGVCCGSTSCPACQACAAGTGACTPLTAGTAAPTSFCTDHGAASCNTNGKCDGAGGCQKYADGTACSAARCPAGAAALTLAGACGGGICSAGPQSCGGYTCDGVSSCQTTCALDGDCAPGYYCAGGSCTGKLAQGTACAADDQCGTDHCVDGVCCGSASCGACHACNVPDSLGVCAAVTPGTDPKNDCADQGAASCGTDGVCGASGACEAYADGTGCSPATCPTGSSLILAGQCGAGACGTTTIHDCAPYKCDGASACLGACAGDQDCTSGSYCAGTACVAKLAVTAACTANSQCANGQCVDGFCCGTASCDSCHSCGIATHEGTCSPKAAGMVCADPTCDPMANQQATAGLCDGDGACTPGVVSSCVLYTCAPDLTACNQSCETNLDCSTGNCDVVTFMCAP
jgi:hypothetical protein